MCDFNALQMAYVQFSAIDVSCILQFVYVRIKIMCETSSKPWLCLQC